MSGFFAIGWCIQQCATGVSGEASERTRFVRERRSVREFSDRQIKKLKKLLTRPASLEMAGNVAYSET
jgi:hypothetical protein